MPAPILIAVELLPSSDAAVKQEVDNEIYYTINTWIYRPKYIYL
jgi:hypothetical protein